MRAVLVVAYLGAIIAANLISATYGPAASIFNAFVLIGLDLTTRDRLHDLWGDNRIRNMAALILSGSLLSYFGTTLLAPDTAPADIIGRIAIASAVAFLIAETGDALIYHRLRELPWLARANGSNILSSALDSVIFVSIAFGFSWAIVLGQIAAKLLGGFLWSVVLAHREVVSA